MSPLRFYTNVDRPSTYAGVRNEMLLAVSAPLSDGSCSNNMCIVDALDGFSVAVHGCTIDGSTRWVVITQ